jgi:hypothetical protein
MKNLFIQIGLVLVIILLLWNSCQMKQENQNLLNQVTSYKEGEKAFKNKILKDSSTIAQQSQTILSQDEAIKLGILKLEGDIKKVQSQVRQQQDISITDLAVPYVPNNYADTSGWQRQIAEGQHSKELLDSLIANSIILPKSFEVNNKWYSIEGQVKKEGLLIDTLKIINESSVTIGWKNSGFLGLNKDPVVEIKNTNPFLNVTKMDNFVAKKKKNIFQTKLFWAGLGLVGGLFIVR